MRGRLAGNANAEEAGRRMSLLLALLIGVFAGVRSLTAPAVTAWAIRLGWLPVGGGLAWLGGLPSVIILTVLALGELIADKLPTTPSRTSPPGLIARAVMGALAGACVASAGGSAAVAGAVLGLIGGIVGCFAGYAARTRLVRALGTPDFYVAILEDVVAIVGCLWIVTRL
ncbi:MAG: DUF4126 family protein [bacterium]